MHGFLANTVPIYWGSPTVAMDFQEGTYISRHDYVTDNTFMDAVIKADQDLNLWERMANYRRLSYKHEKYWNLERFNAWFMLNVYKGVLS